MRINKFPFLVLIAAFALNMLSCKSQKNAASNNAANKDSLFVSIQKFPCFGVCPHYEAKIFKGGYVWYDGKRNTDKTGIYESKISQHQMNEILQQAKNANYFLLPDSFYNAGIADYPVVITSLNENGKRKTIYDGATEATADLQKFEKYLHEFFHSTDLKWRLIKKPGGDE